MLSTVQQVYLYINSFNVLQGGSMEHEANGISRRDFLNAAAIGSAVLAAGPVFKIAAKEALKTPMPEIYVCSICGHVEFAKAPENCPVCHAPKEKFAENNSVFTDAINNYKDAGISHTPDIVVKKKSAFISEMPATEVEVRIGKKMHPMEEQHHIRYMDFYVDDKYVSRIFLTLGSLPAATFFVKAGGTSVRIIEVCSVHGYWQAEASVA
jgi:desulfoferrodoxin-like iron-binding protein